MASKMIDTGIEYIGTIPEHWRILKIKHTYSMQTGFTPDTEISEYYDDENGYVWVTIRDLTSDRYIENSEHKISKLYLDEKNPKIIPKNSLLYSFKLSIGQVAFAKNELYSNEAIVSFLEKADVNLGFLYYSSSLIKHNANENIYGAKLLNQFLIKNAVITFPPLDEQKKISDFLNNKIDTINIEINKLKELVVKYQEYKQSLITEIITTGLNKNVEMKESGIDWIDKIPKHWEIDYLKHRVTLNGSTLTDNTDANYEFKYIDIGSVSFENGIEKYETMLFKDAPSRARRIVEKDDVIISTVRTYLKAIAIIPEEKDLIVSTGFAVLTPTNINSRYLGYVVKSEYFINLVSANSVGVLYPGINSNKLINFKIVIPPNKEQEEIANFLDEKINPIDNLIVETEELIKKLEEYKKSLIFEYVTGKEVLK